MSKPYPLLSAARMKAVSHRYERAQVRGAR
jgi:hypothetical protein